GREAIHIFQKDQGGTDNWGRIKEILTPGGTNYFGSHVAIDGDYIIVSNFVWLGVGSAYVYYKDEGGADNWGLQATLTPSDGAAGLGFAYSVDISGEYAVVGAMQRAADTGAVYTYKRTGASWAEDSITTASDATAGDQYGYDVSINGSNLIVGAPYNDYNTYTDNGRIYIYDYAAPGWTEIQVNEMGNANNINFGYAVDMSDELAVAGAPGYNSNEGAIMAVYESGGAWNSRDNFGTLLNSYANHKLGWDVAVDNGNLIIGKNDSNSGTAHAFLFTQTDISSDFADTGFFDCVRNSIAPGTPVILVGATKSLVTLNATYCENDVNSYDSIIESIEGIQWLFNLQTANLQGNKITDLTPLSEIQLERPTYPERLSVLDLSNNGITDISPLDGMGTLTELYIGNDTMELLDNYYLHYNNISDISTVDWSTFNNLTTLSIKASSITDISPLSTTRGLTSLDIRNNLITDISPLSGLTTLKYLNVGNDFTFVIPLNENTIIDFSPITNLVALTDLYLDNLDITNVTPFKNLTNLVNIRLRHNGISDITPLDDNAAFASGNTIDIAFNDYEAPADLTDYNEKKTILDQLVTDGATLVTSSSLPGMANPISITFENCTNGLDDDGDTYIDLVPGNEDPYCLPDTFYVNYSGGSGADCGLSSGDPCDSIQTLATEVGPAIVLPPHNDVTILVDGTSISQEYIFMQAGPDRVYPGSVDITVQQWVPASPAIIMGSHLITGSNITLDGFIYTGDTTVPGVAFIGGENLTVRNSGFIGMAVGVGLGGGINNKVYNNGFINNAGTANGNDFGFYGVGVIDVCGGVLVAGSLGAQIVNNSFYDNCTSFSIFDRNDPITTAALEIGDIAVISAYDFTPLSAPQNTIVKQNLVYNSNGAANKYYYDVVGNNINAVAAVGTLINQNAVDHGGNNFIAATDPYTNVGGGDFSIKTAEVANYQTCDIAAETPSTDALGAVRPSGPLEAGAVESTGGSCSTGSSAQPEKPCVSNPVKLNIPNKLPVSIIGGKPVVKIDWANVQNLNSDTKMVILLDYIKKKQTIGINKPKGIFTSHVRDMILDNANLSDYYYKKLNTMKLGDLTDCNCNDPQAEAMLSIINDMKNNDMYKATINGIASKFADDLLSLESTLKEAGGAKTPFTDYYKGYFIDVETEGVVKIYRDGKLIHTEENSYNTSFVDRTIPKNTTGRVKYYNYYLVNETSCGSETGSTGKAQINPIVPQGTEIDVNFDLKIKVKRSYDELIMDKVHDLIETNGSTADLCEEARVKFEGERTEENILDYILECYGRENEALRSKIEEGQVGIVVPLMLLTESSVDSSIIGSFAIDIDEIADEFMEPIITDFMQQICDDARDDFQSRRTSDSTLNYLVECFTEGNTSLRNKIIEKRGDIVTPLMIMLNLNQSGGESDLTTEDIVNEFVYQVIGDLFEEISTEAYVLASISELELSESLLNKNDIDELTEDEKTLILQISENYFRDASHAANITIEIYEGEELIRQIGTGGRDEIVHTNIFGEVIHQIGKLAAGTEYTIKVGLADVQYFLPKTASLEINNAELTSGGYIADVALEFSKFKYGNFDEKDDEINKDDLIAWGNLLRNNPEQWGDVNIDGFTGINLLDVITLQEHWGIQEAMDIEEGQISLSDLLDIFGLSLTGSFSSDAGVVVPEWINYTNTKCE
ncbi:hypothetical protein KKA95_00905, partial [Patescibacteria group bacterium]|nr:hypothetical protein [Patescibacteria group bacterium]